MSPMSAGFLATLRDGGLPASLPRAKKKRRPRVVGPKLSARDRIFLAALADAGIPEPTPEYRFHATRKWRIDWAFVEAKLALEQEGGIWKRGRHNRPAGYLADVEKYNELARLGWRLIRVTPSQLHGLSTIELIRECLCAPRAELSIHPLSEPQ